MFDYDDGNWLNVTAFYSNENASVTISGTFIMITDIACFAEKCEELIARKTDIARIQTLDPEFNIEIKKIDPLGHLEMTVQITPDHILQEHTFRIEIDQSYLPDIIKQCRKIESKYPVRGAPCKKIFNKISKNDTEEDIHNKEVMINKQSDLTRGKKSYVVSNSGILTIIVLVLCSTWNALILAVFLYYYLYTVNKIVLDYHFEIQCISSILNLTLPVGIGMIVLGIILFVFKKISISSFCIAAIFFISTILPVIPVAEHLDRIHAGTLEWSSEVWWLPK